MFIVGLPGVGNVGKIAADFICEGLKGKRFATVYSENFPPQVTLDEQCVAHMACNELYYAKSPSGRDIIFLRGDYQGSTPEGQYILCEEIMNDVLLRMDVTYICTLGGYGTGTMVDTPRVLGAVSDAKLKEGLNKIGVIFSPGEPAAGIVGASGLFLGMGKANKIDSVCLMGETSGYFVDHKSGIAVIKVLESMLSIELDTKDLDIRSQQIDELTAKVKEYEVSHNKEDLGYIG